LTIGMRNNDVTWLRNTLLATKLDQGASSSSKSKSVIKSDAIKTKNLFDEILLQQVIEFQRTHHLEADGVVGVQTQIALDAMLNADHGPVLASIPNT